MYRECPPEDFCLQETWDPENAVLAQHLPELVEQANAFEIDATSAWHAQVIDLGRNKAFGKAEILSCVSALPHVDTLCERWTALLVLRSNGHTLSCRHITRDDSDELDEDGMTCDAAFEDDPGEPDETTVLNQGEILLLDAHRLHWLDLANECVQDWDWQVDGPQKAAANMFVAVHSEFDHHPSREEVEERLCQLLQLDARLAPCRL